MCTSLTNSGIEDANRDCNQVGNNPTLFTKRNQNHMRKVPKDWGRVGKVDQRKTAGTGGKTELPVFYVF